MIQPQDIRINNLVLYKDEVSIVKGVLQTCVDLLVSPCVRFTKIALLPNIYPIPLTEEWLVRLGFNYFQDQFDDMPVYTRDELEWYLDSEYQPNDSGFPMIKYRLYFVHQLQNLYFALTGQELLINPKSV